MNKPSKKLAKARALKAMSDYIRQRDNWVCFTCGRRGDKYTMDAGHLISRVWSATLFDEFNVNCQCKPCNKYRHPADPEIYRQAFIDAWGESAYHELYRKSKEPVKRSVDDYLAIEKDFKERLEGILNV